MKKLSLIILSLLLIFLTGCGKTGYKITFDDTKVFNCPKRAKEGEVITFDCVDVSDADLYVYVNGEEVFPNREGHYKFVMPDTKVEIKVVIIANGLA